MNRIDEQHGPHQRPTGRIEHGPLHFNRLSIGRFPSEDTQGSQDAGENEKDAHRSHYPHQIVHPRAKTEDAQIFLRMRHVIYHIDGSIFSYLGFVRTFFHHVANIEDECHHIDDRIEQGHKETEASVQWIQEEFRASEMIEKDL
jgi:hypothetical protein